MEQIEAEQTPEQELCEILKVPVDEPEINQTEEFGEKINVQPEIKPVDPEIKEKQNLAV